MKPCDRDLAKQIYSNSAILNKDGVDIIIKAIPDSDKTGVMDEREFEVRSAIEKFRKMIPQKFSLENWRKATRSYCLNLNDEEVLHSDFVMNVDGRQVKVLVSEPASKTGPARPAFIYIHGGSFMTSSAEYYTQPCDYIAEKANCVTFNIEYSLAPENRYPIQINECIVLLRYIHEHAEEYNIDTAKIAISGDSAGGNLAVAAVLDCPEEIRPFYMALFYPCVDLFGRDNIYEWKEEEYDIDDSERELILSRLTLGRADGKGNNEMMDFIFKSYIGPEYDNIKKNADISPVYADLSVLAGKVKVHIFTAEFDALRLQAEYFAKRLDYYNVENKIFRYRGVSHAFLDYFGTFPQAEAAVMEIVNELI